MLRKMREIQRLSKSNGLYRNSLHNVVIETLFCLANWPVVHWRADNLRLSVLRNEFPRGICRRESCAIPHNKQEVSVTVSRHGQPWCRCERVHRAAALVATCPKVAAIIQRRSRSGSALSRLCSREADSR